MAYPISRYTTGSEKFDALLNGVILLIVYTNLEYGSVKISFC